MFFDLEEAKKEGNYLTWESIGELAEWTPVHITDVEELPRGKKTNDDEDQPQKKVTSKTKRRNVYHIITFCTIECERTFKISFFRMNDLIELMTNALQMTQCEHHDELVGKSLSVKLGVEHNEKNDKKYIKIERSRPYTGSDSSSAPKQASSDQTEEIPF